MDTEQLYELGLKRRKEMFGSAAVEQRMNALGEFGKPLQQIINGYAYGDIWGRSGLPPKIRSLVMIGMMAASNHPPELRVHLRGAIANGCTREEIREVLLQIALYCGIPASLEAHHAALEVFGASGGKPAGQSGDQ